MDSSAPRSNGLHHRIAGFTPICVDAAHHDGDDQRYQLGHDVAAVLELRTIDRAVPRRAAVHELIAHGVDALQDLGEQIGRVVLGKQFGRALLAAGESLFPLVLGDLSALVRPERLIDVRRIEQHANRAAEFLPDHPIEMFLSVLVVQPIQEFGVRRLCAQTLLWRQFLSVGGVEGDPQKNEFSVGVVFTLLGTIEPTERSVNAHVQPHGHATADFSMVFFE